MAKISQEREPSSQKTLRWRELDSNHRSPAIATMVFARTLRPDAFRERDQAPEARPTTARAEIASAVIKSRHPALYRQLPASYSVGEDALQPLLEIRARAQRMADDVQQSPGFKHGDIGLGMNIGEIK
jgi:hypothetical protein